jgi:ABC-type proline/glycine betaine transport system permease subunit/ABC-type proline/glycine betaine transport system ATPase subunit
VILEFRNVSKVYGGHASSHAISAVQDFSLSVARGEVLCLMGNSGSGKSTLLRHVNRLIEPSSGELFVNGESISALSARDLRQFRSQRIGMVFQHFGLLPHRNVRDNVAFPLELRGEPETVRHAEAERQLQAVGLSAWADRYPAELSGGMQQRVGLARALVIRPEILLLDEPFSALDPTIRRELQTHFLRIARERNITVILVTHDPAEALRVGDRIAVMRGGQLVQVGTREDLLERPVDTGVAEFFSDNQSFDLSRPPSEEVAAGASSYRMPKEDPLGRSRLGRLLLGPVALAGRGREGLFWMGMAAEMGAVAAFFTAWRAASFPASATSAAVWLAVRVLCAWAAGRGAETARRAWIPQLLLLLVMQGFIAWRAIVGDSGPLVHFPENRDAMLFLASAIDRLIAWSQVTFEGAFVGVIFTVRSVIESIQSVLDWLPWPVPAGALVFVAWRSSGVALAVTSAAALVYLGAFGFWERTIATLALVGSSVFLSLLIGLPTGVLLARRPFVQRLVSPLLDVMQTLPTFVYLIPAVAFFSVGKTPAVIATVIFALPPMIRLTALGIREVPKASIEAAVAHGATPWQTLTKVELPLASGSLLLGINQTIVMSLSMVVVAALIGADGLGYDVMTALRNIRGGEGMLAGFAIVFCALIPDRIIQSTLKKRHKLSNPG